MFIVRDMAFGNLVGEPFAGGRFKWPNTNDWCEMAAAHGLELRSGSIVLQKVYEIVDTISGAGSVITYGNCVYDPVNDRVTRAVTLSKSQTDLDKEAEDVRIKGFSDSSAFQTLLAQLKTATAAQINNSITNNYSAASTIAQVKAVALDYQIKTAMVLAYLVRGINV